ncbi:MAG: hypothetical protein SO160_02250 [Lachnospiraceae bacterium]|nr:hypothetical protein [Lachnospiraceae bacterium]
MRYYDSFGRKKRITIAVIISVLCVAFIASNLYQSMEMKSAINKTLAMGYDTVSDEEYENTLKETPSDISGMSRYDKYEMGLQTADNSDSDYDGLTDKEEIEVYHSDPLKASTAGDLYMDGYKVKNGMDVATFYDYDGNIEFSNNECGEVKLEADNAMDLTAVVKDVTDTYTLDDFGITVLYKGYRLYNYSGKVSIDTSDILPADVKLKNVKVKIFKGVFPEAGLGKLEESKYSEEEGVITPEYTFESEDTYYLFLTGKTTIASSLASATGLSESYSEESDSGIGLSIIFPLIGNITKFTEGAEFIYSTMSDVDTTYAFRDAFIDQLNNNEFSSYDTDILSKDSKNVISSEKNDIILKYSILKKFFAPFEYTGEQHWYHFFLMYTLYDYESGTVVAANGIHGENGDKEDRKEYNNYHTSFDAYTDELCFQNFESDYGPNGNCLGIAHFTSYLYNNGTYPSSGSYGDISWDLNTDEENKTLMDPGIYDYKNIHFVDERTGENDDYLSPDVLSSGENEFVKMIGASFQEGNDRIDTNSFIKTNGELNDYSMLEKAMAYIDQGKVVNVCLILNNGTGHAITLYDYYYVDDDSVNFRVYDSNIPQNDRNNYYIHADGACYLQCSAVTRPDGTKAFQYLYHPLENNTEYMATSYSYLMQKNGIAIVDENWNIFN